jgi:hypothetical protein
MSNILTEYDSFRILDDRQVQKTSNPKHNIPSPEHFRTYLSHHYLTGFVCQYVTLITGLVSVTNDNNKEIIETITE